MSEPGRPLLVTHFATFAATSKRETWESLDTLAASILQTSRPTKAALPWLKLAKFGDVKTINDKGEPSSLRHDANVQGCSGLEADYDGERLDPEDAVEILTKAGVSALVYTTPSHAPGKPRWRVLAPFSTMLAPNDRLRSMGRLNGLFGGVLANESWTLSQSYYFGRVAGNPHHMAEVIDGDPIDKLDELDEIWTGKSATGKAKLNGSGIPHSGPVDQIALLQAIEDGKDYHSAMVRLLGVWALDDGVPMVEAKRRLDDAMETTFPPDRDKRWYDRKTDIARSVKYVYGKEDAKPTNKTKPAEPEGNAKTQDLTWSICNPVSLEHKPVPEREWIVEGYIPAGVVTALYADGGLGKTLLAIMLQVACGIGASWCGMAVKRCRSFALYCEDDPDELHRRAARICDHYRVGFGDLGDMRWISGVGCDNILVEPGDGRMQRTSRLLQLEDGITAHGAELAILDTAADLFAGNEINRTEVRQFISELNALAIRTGCTILLMAHPSKDGLKNATYDGGSTAWNNSVRSRLSLARPIGDDADPDERILAGRKANYGALGGPVRLRWHGGVLVPLESATGLNRLARTVDAEQTFLALLARFAGEGRRVSDNPKAGNNAAKAFAACPDRNGHSHRELETAMQRLFAAGKITTAEYGRASGSGVRPQQIVAANGPQS